MSSVSAKDISDCISVWMSYLQMLNGLCSAGSRLSQGLQSLLGSSQGHVHAAPMASHCRNMWDELARVTAATTATVRSSIIAALQESALRINNQDATKCEIGDVACASLSTFINMQYQFCLSCCECLRSMKMTRGIPEPREDCPLPSCRPSLAPMQVGQQRRWSEEVAPKGRSASVPDAGDTGPRRWSMPWESGGSQNTRLSPSMPGGFPNPLPLVTPATCNAPPRETSHRSGSTTPDSIWHGSSFASMEDLQGVIHLLSCQPGSTLPNCHVTHLHQPSQHVPGVTLTSCSLNEKDMQSSWDWGLESLGTPASTKCSPSVDDTPTSVEEETARILSGSQSYASNLLHPGSSSRVIPGVLNLPGLQPWCEGDGASGNLGTSSGWTQSASTESGGLSRKSSSSTDSSAYSRSVGSGSDGGSENRSHLYCMWKGEAPFIQLTESLVEGEGCESATQLCSSGRNNSGKLEEESRVGDPHPPVPMASTYGEERIPCQDEDEILVMKERT
ncbi:uncharacterized protein LOC124153832 [Ischnura elegans]|uniref:uncharacterized protein LOC124153832 n=1 Tax=Ischnura elegans TaxID=197161 RepID=UPI001ED8B2FF|nr:uncharacterized protein LOC124153832 [Ischnura elegans]